MVLIFYTQQSKKDLKSIVDFISKDSKKYAKLQVVRIQQRIQGLKTFQYSGKVLLEINGDEMRELIEGNYRIIYKIIDTHRIDILTIHHSSRDLANRKIVSK